MAINIETLMNEVIGIVLSASVYALSGAARYGSPDARSAFEALMRAAAAMNDLGTRGGRCGIDIYGGLPDSWSDWRKGVRPETAAQTPPAVPSSCGKIIAPALDPIVTLLTSVIVNEQAQIAAYPGEDYNEYAEADLDSAKAQLTTIQALRDSLATSGRSAADVPTANAIFSAMATLAPSALIGGQEALDTESCCGGLLASSGSPRLFLRTGDLHKKTARFSQGRFAHMSSTCQ